MNNENEINNFEFKLEDDKPKNIFKCQFFKVGYEDEKLGYGKIDKDKAYCSLRDEELSNYKTCCTKHEGQEPSKYLRCQSYQEKFGNMSDKDRLELRNLKLIRESVIKAGQSVQQARKANILNWVMLFITLTSVFFTIYFSNKNFRIANSALSISKESLSIFASKEGVNLRPLINVSSMMYKNSDLKAPKIIISNDGKVEALNVLVQIIRRQFDGEKFVGAVWGGGEGNQYIFEKMVTFESKEIRLPEEYVVNPEYNVIELRIHYMRNYDKQLYSYRTFYFYQSINSEFGTWTNIQRAKLDKSYNESKIIEQSEKLPIELYDEKMLKIINDGLTELN